MIGIGDINWPLVVMIAVVLTLSHWAGVWVGRWQERQRREEMSEQLQTHHEDCWRLYGHSLCAIRKVERLTAALQKLKAMVFEARDGRDSTGKLWADAVEAVVDSALAAQEAENKS